MSTLTLLQTKDALSKINSYPKPISDRLYALRQLILEAAEEIESIDKLEETLKWGEPSYLAKKGSTIRIDWKSKNPDHYSLYFKCTSKLVSTFREVYGDIFQYENNRALVFAIDQDIPTQEVKQCIKVALQYHSIKHLDNLGLS